MFPVGTRHQDPPLPTGVIPAFEYGRYHQLQNIWRPASPGDTPGSLSPGEDDITKQPVIARSPIPAQQRLARHEETQLIAVVPKPDPPVAERPVSGSNDGHTRTLHIGTTPAEVVSRMGTGRRGFRSGGEELDASGRPWVVPPPPRLNPSQDVGIATYVPKERRWWRWSRLIFAALLAAYGIALIANHW